MSSLIITTHQKREILDLTEKIQEEIEKIQEKEGLCYLFLTHTTAGLMLADLDPGAEKDYFLAFENLLPELKYHHPHNPLHFSDHFLASLVGQSLLLPVKEGKLVLGAWQRVVLVEFNGPRKREILFHFLKV